MKLMRTLSALSLLALPLSAQVALEVSGSAVIATQDMKKMVADNSAGGTHGANLAGTTLGAALRIPVSEDFGYRVHANLLGFKGTTGSGLESAAPRHLYGGLDATQQLGKGWMVYGGLMAVKWKQDEDKITNPNYGDIARASGNTQLFPSTNNTNNSPKGVKLGVRVGVEKALSKSWAFNASFQQVEFNKIYNPSWLNVGLTYKFGAK